MFLQRIFLSDSHHCLISSHLLSFLLWGVNVDQARRAPHKANAQLSL